MRLRKLKVKRLNRRLNKIMEGNRENTLKETLKNDLSEDALIFEMANLLPCRTGLKYQVWYSANYKGQKPRIKVDYLMVRMFIFKLKIMKLMEILIKSHRRNCKGYLIGLI